MRILLLASLFLVVIVPAFCQQNVADSLLKIQIIQRQMDSIKATYLETFALKYPLLRQAGVSIEVIGAGQVHSKLLGNDMYKGQLQITRLKGYLAIPIAHIKKNTIATTVGVLHQWTTLTQITPYDSSKNIEDRTLESTILSSTISFTRLDSLFGRPVVISVLASGLLNPTTFQTRLTGTGVMTMNLKQTANSSFSLGMLFLLDLSSPIPAAPFFRYYHNFKRYKLEFFVDAPSRIALRKELSRTQSLSFFTELGGSLVFFKLSNQTYVPRDNIFTTMEIKSGLVYEQRLSRKVVLGVQGGISSTISQKIQERTVLKNDPFIKNKQSPLPYMNVSLSFLPFWKGLNL